MVWVIAIWLRVCAIRVRVILLRTIFVIFKSFGPSMILFLDCLLSPFDIFELSTFILRFFRSVHYALKIMFGITLWCIPHYCRLSSFQVKWEFATSVRTFQVHLSFPTSAKIFQLQWNFPTPAKLSNFRRNIPTSVLSNFALFFSISLDSFQLR